MADVFISYARTRKEVTAALANDLEAAGFSVWWDKGILPSQQYRKQITQQLNGSKVVIVIWTDEAIDSVWVAAEAERGLGAHKLINTHVPDFNVEEIPIPFGQVQSVRVDDHDAIIAAARELIAGPAPVPVPPEPRKRKGWLSGLLARERPRRLAAVAVAGVAVAAGILGIVAWRQTSSAPVPQWTLERTSFIASPIQFKWSYDARAAPPGRAVWYELESAGDTVLGFIRLDRHDPIYSDRTEKEVRHVNASRLWRVRAVDRPDDGRRALSGWSAELRIAQYESAFERIKATRRVLLYVSDSQNQGIFKWVGRRARGFDIDLANAIAAAMSSSLRDGRPLQQPVDPISVPFSEVLAAPHKGLADMSIASITKLTERERDLNLRFSETYFCTTFSVLHRAGEPDRPVRELIAGLAGAEKRTVGVQKGSTGALLFAELNKERGLPVEEFGTSEGIAAALRNGTIRYGVTDTTFAAATKLSFPRELDYKEFSKRDFPASFPTERQIQNYGVAVRAGEDELLDVINRTIIGMRNDGALLRMLKKAAQDYEEEHKGRSANLVPSDQPWACSVPD